jgi:hypothetical protein
MSKPIAGTLGKDSSIGQGSELIDRAWLSAWIQPQHLENNVIQTYREEFTSHPANMIVLKNVLLNETAAKLSCFINSEAEVETLYGLYSVMENNPNGLANVTEEEWSGAEEEDRFFRLRKFVRVSPQRRLTPNLATYLSFLAAFNKPTFRYFFEEITGLTFDLKDATYHLFTYKRGDFLRAHTDRGGKYLLAFILYLSPEWEPRFGGDLNILLSDGKIAKLEPEYNSLVLFNVNAQATHFVSPVEDCAGEVGRSTFSGWLHRPS